MSVLKFSPWQMHAVMTSQWNPKEKQWLRIKPPVMLARHKVESNLLSVSSVWTDNSPHVSRNIFPVGKSKENEWQTRHIAKEKHKVWMSAWTLEHQPYPMKNLTWWVNFSADRAYVQCNSGDSGEFCILFLKRQFPFLLS